MRPGSVSENDIPAGDADWPRGFEGARIANLLHFADRTPEQKVQWLADMLELMRLARQARDHDRTSTSS